MVESLKELNRLCQKPRYKEVGNWMVRKILRDAALPITWALLHTPVTAHQVTLASLVIALLGVSLVAFPPVGYFLGGTLLLQVWYLLDHVDGQIARYRGTASLTGRFFDFLTHHLIHGVIFFSLGVYGFRVTGRFGYVVWGFVTSVSIVLFNLLNDTKYKTFFEKIVTLKSLTLAPAKGAEPAGSERGEKSFTKKGFSLLHKLCEIHVLMNILTVAALFEAIQKPAWDFRLTLFWWYGITAPLIAVVKSTYLIKGRKIDEEFEQLFGETSETRR